MRKLIILLFLPVCNYMQAQQYSKELEDAAGTGNAQAMYELALCYDKGAGVKQDRELAFKWYNYAAQQGQSEAQRYIGDYYFNKKNYYVAFDWYWALKANKEDDASLFYQIAKCAENIPSLKREYRGFLTRAANLGSAEAQYLLGLMCCPNNVGSGVQRPLMQAIQWFQMAAQQGHVPAMRELGTLYYTGGGDLTGQRYHHDTFTPRYDMAAIWVKKAADLGDTDAMVLMAKMYETGQGVKQDVKSQMEYTRKAALKGNRTACFNLGLSYYTGKGNTKNLREAYKWLHKAERDGLTSAIPYCNSLRKQGIR